MTDFEKCFYFVNKGGEYAVRLCMLTKNMAEDFYIPAKYRGMPVTEIEGNAFFLSDHLSEVTVPEGIRKIGIGAFSFSSVRSVILPYSLKVLKTEAFSNCNELEQVVFLGNKVLFGCDVFKGCPKLAAENVMQGLAQSCDNTKPFVDIEDSGDNANVNAKKLQFDWDSAFRDDVFELALKYDSFAQIGKGKVLKAIVERGLIHLLYKIEKAEWVITDKLMGELLDLSAQKGFVEITAWLLDYKNRNFGFNTNNFSEEL